MCVADAFAGPPIKLIKVTVINKCEWDVPAGSGRDVNLWWFNSEEKEKLTIKRVPANGRVIFENVQAGVKDFNFVVFNETTNHSRGNDEMEYNWEIEDDVLPQ
jgi:hypothetical protein